MTQIKARPGAVLGTKPFSAEELLLTFDLPERTLVDISFQVAVAERCWCSGLHRARNRHVGIKRECKHSYLHFREGSPPTAGILSSRRGVTQLQPGGNAVRQGQRLRPFAFERRV